MCERVYGVLSVPHALTMFQSRELAYIFLYRSGMTSLILTLQVHGGTNYAHYASARGH